MGSGAHCDVRLALDQARVEHVRIDVTPQGVFATALSYEPPPTMNGAPFSQVALQQGVPIVVHQTTILISLKDSVGTGTSAKKKSASSPATAALGALAIAIAAFLLWDSTRTETSAGKGRDAPQLFDKKGVNCPYQGQQAQAYGEQNLTLAESLRERTPFAVEDGVRSVGHFRLAAACYQSAGMTSYVRYAEEGALELENSLERDYRKERIRLKRAVDYEDWNRARRSIRRLLAFTEGYDEEYRAMLKELDSRLQLKAKRETGG